MPKQKVYFKEFNAVEYLGHHMIVTQTDDEAEYEIVLLDGDKLIEQDEGLYLVRDNKWYLQTTRMSSFKGVNFTLDAAPDPGEKKNVQCKLLELS